MRAMVWNGRVPGYLALVTVAASLGGCKAAAEVCFGSPTEMDPFLAAFHRQAQPVKI